MIEFGVSEINNYIKNILTSDINLKSISLEGEVTSFKAPSRNGHLYFELKDEDSRIRCVFFNIYDTFTDIPFKEGDNVILKGRIDVYERSGQYQFIVTDARVEGMGELYNKFIKLKEKLDKEGLFDKTKRKIPTKPFNIGLITSPTGAAVKDFISVIRRRFPIAKIHLYPVHVQGVETVNEVCKAIDYFNNMELDVVVLTRGGGSYDELSVFNNEKIARKLVTSKNVTVSAIGHEPDFLITDFVADLRASTPTAAAEMISDNLFDTILQKKISLRVLALGTLDKINRRRKNLIILKRMLNNLSPNLKIDRERSKIKDFKRLLLKLYKLKFLEEKNKINHIKSCLTPFDIKEMLAKGYSITLDKNGELISEKNNYIKGDKIKTIFKKGSIVSEII